MAGRPQRRSFGIRNRGGRIMAFFVLLGIVLLYALWAAWMEHIYKP